LRFRFDPVGYAREVLGVELWSGGDSGKGQRELVEDIAESVRAQASGESANQVFRVEAGHGVGKTFVAAVLVNWFFDCFSPSITITTAPTEDQVRLLLWKDIRSLRSRAQLPGKVLPEDPKMVRAHDWFAIGRTTSNAGGKGSARMQGQHPDFWFYVLDEAEGVPEFMYGAVDGMMTGGRVGLVLMLANPQTRTSMFHRKGKQSGVRNYRLSVLDHPNVVTGREVVSGATKRKWADEKIANWCEIVPAHDEDRHTFEVNWPVPLNGEIAPAGTIFLPNAEFCFRVLGIAPTSLADKVFVSPGRYCAALSRVIEGADPSLCKIGVDCARFGKDAGTVYREHALVASCEARLSRQDTFSYVAAVRAAALSSVGATSLSVRVDGTGGFGSGIVDLLLADEELRSSFSPFVVHEVHFNGAARNGGAYANIATEMYAEAAESLRGLRLERVPIELERDLTDRCFEYVNRGGVTLKALTEKEKFRRLHGSSPDDGDGFALAVTPEFLFSSGASSGPGVGVASNELIEGYRPFDVDTYSGYDPFRL